MKDKSKILKHKLNKYINSSLDLSDAVEEYLTTEEAKVELAKQMRKVKQDYNDLEDYIKTYNREGV